MDNNTVSMKKIKIQIKVKQAKDWTKKQVDSAINFVKDNPQVAIAGLGAVAASAKAVKRLATNHSDQVARERRIYDPRKGRYSEMRRKPTNKEWREIDQRYENGENYRAILDDMRLLKF